MHLNKKTSKSLIYGKHAAIAALQNPNRKIHAIYATPDTIKLVPSNVKQKLQNKIIISTTKDITNLIPSFVNHQNIVIIVDEIHFDLEDLPLTNDPSLIICLDQITDTHNIGAIIRSAAAFKACALIVPKDNFLHDLSKAFKSAAGTIELIPLIKVTNLRQAFNFLKKHNYWVVGLDHRAERFIHTESLPAKTVLVLGSEGTGMRRLTREDCDLLYKIPIAPSVESINVSNAAAIGAFEFYKKYYA